MFDRLALRYKLTLGFGSVLLLLSLVAGIGFMAMSNSTEGFRTYRGLARDTNLSGRVQVNMLMVRMNVKDYLITGSDKDKQQFAEYWQKVQGFMQEAQEEITPPEEAALIDEIDRKLRDYEKGFKEVVALVDQRNEQVTGVLNVVGPRMEKSLTKILLAAKENNNMAAAYKASLATRNLLLTRIYVIKYLESNQQSAIDRVNQELTELDKNLAMIEDALQSANSHALLQEVRPQKAAYAKSFAEVTRLIQAHNDIVKNRLDLIGPEVASKIENVKLAIKAEQDDLGPELQAKNKRAQTLVVVISLMAIATGIGMAIMITRGIVGPMKQSCAMIEELEKGHLDMRLNLSSQDEIGQMARTMDRFADSLQNEMVDSLQKLAAGDLVFQVTPKDDQDLIRGALQELRQDLNALVGQIQNAGEQIASGSSQISDGTQGLSQGANESAASVEQISASMNQLASQTKQNAENAAQANQLVNQAKAAAEKGNEQMQEMVSAMFEINEDGQNISKIIKVIDEIAFQTNLLALNAAVEAARAGQHGKGFAVVAEEVRNLAARSAQAAKETAELIEGSVHKTQNGTQIANQTEAALKEIVSGVIKTADLVSEISVASDEQSQGIDQINQGLSQIDLVTQQNTANAEESAAATEELSSQAEEMRRMLSRFKADGAQTLNPPKASNKSRGIQHLPNRTAAPMADEDFAPSEKNPRAVIALSDEEFGKD